MSTARAFKVVPLPAVGSGGRGSGDNMYSKNVYSFECMGVGEGWEWDNVDSKTCMHLDVWEWERGGSRDNMYFKNVYSFGCKRVVRGVGVRIICIENAYSFGCMRMGKGGSGDNIYSKTCIHWDAWGWGAGGSWDNIILG